MAQDAHEGCETWLIATILFVSLAHAATLPPVARDEIDTLLMRLKTSGCQFKRNGSWHTAVEAQAHLRRKLEYLVDKGAVASAEQFIERAASRSSMSGHAYQVKCGSEAPVASGQWLYTELQALRAGTKDCGRQTLKNFPGPKLGTPEWASAAYRRT